jgi:hypothetical protein
MPFQVPGFETVEIKYKTFIACEVAGPTPMSPLHYDFFKGDNRGFDYNASPGQSRTWQRLVATVDPFTANGIVSNPLQAMGITKGYDDDPDGSDVMPLANPYCGASLQCAYGFVPGATAECTEQIVDPVSAGVLSIEVLRISALEIEVHIVVDAYDQCQGAWKVPNENTDLTLRIRKLCQNGLLGSTQFRGYGTYDGYPWLELYLNAVLEYSHDPCRTNDTPWSMMPVIGNYEFTNPPIDPDTEEPITQPLTDWQDVEPPP